MSPQAETAQSSSGRPSHLAARVAVGVLIALVTAVMVGKYLHHDTKDVPVWYDVGGRVLNKQTLVGLTSYRYPPTFAVLISPLCALPFAAFFFVWYAINVGLFFVAIRQTAHLTCSSRGTFRPEQTAGWASFRPEAEALERCVPWPVAAICAVYAIDNLFLGQTNLLVMVLLYGSFLYLLRRREWAAGVPLGLSIAVKVFTAPMIAYLLYRRRWRAALSTVLSSLFFLLLFPAPFRGLDRNLAEVGDWGKRVVAPYLSKGKAGDWGQHALDLGNQSVQAVAHRYLRRVDANVAARQSEPIYVNFAGLSESQVNAIVLATFAVLAAVFVAACGWRAPRTREQEVTEYALVTIGLLLISAIAWTYFFVMLLLPLAVAVRLLALTHEPTVSHRRALWFSVVAFGLVTVLLRLHYLRALGSVCFASVLLYLALAGAVWTMRRGADLPRLA